jgi:hypothetical protein
MTWKVLKHVNKGVDTENKDNYSINTNKLHKTAKKVIGIQGWENHISN